MRQRRIELRGGSKISRRMLIEGALAGAAFFKFSSGLSAGVADRRGQERLYREALVAGDAFEIARERYNLAAVYRYDISQPGSQTREKAIEMFMAGFKPSAERVSRQFADACRLNWCEMMLEDSRERTARNLAKIRRELAIAAKGPAADQLALKLAISGMHAALLSSDINQAERWFRLGLIEANGGGDVEKYAAFAEAQREELASFYRLRAQIAVEKRDALDALRWIETGNAYSRVDLSTHSLTAMPDMRNRIRDAQKLANHHFPVAHLLVSKAGSAIIVTCRDGAGIHSQIHACQGLTAPIFDNKDLEALLWGDLFIHVRARGILGGWYGALASGWRGEGRLLNRETLISVMPTLARRIWDTLGKSIKRACARAGIDRALFVVMPPELAVVPLQIGHDGKSYPFLDQGPCLLYGPDSGTLLRAAGRSRSAARPVLQGLYNISDGRGTAEAERSIMEQSFLKRGDVRRLPAGMNGRALLQRIANSDSDWIYLAGHGEFNAREGSRIAIGAGEALTLDTVNGFRQDLRARMVILAACETATVDKYGFGRVVSLPEAFLRKGVSGVVAARWIVNDAAATLLLAMFLELPTREPHLVPAEQLVRAQIWLRDADSRFLAQWIGQRADASDANNKSALRLLAARFDRLPPASRPFANPFYWGAFSFYGV